LLPEAGALVSSQPTAREAAAPEVVLCGLSAGSAGAAEAAHARYLEEIISPAVLPQAVELVQQHKNAGATTIVITATNEFVASPVARLFGPDLVMAVDLQHDENTGWFKGLVRGVPSFRVNDLPGYWGQDRLWMVEQDLMALR